MMLLIFVIMFVNRFIVISIKVLLLNSYILSCGSRVDVVGIRCGTHGSKSEARILRAVARTEA